MDTNNEYKLLNEALKRHTNNGTAGWKKCTPNIIAKIGDIEMELEVWVLRDDLWLKNASTGENVENIIESYEWKSDKCSMITRRTYKNRSYIPYDNKEIVKLVGKPILDIDTGDVTLVINVYYDSGFRKCELANGTITSSVAMFNDYTFMDGSPIGVCE